MILLPATLARWSASRYLGPVGVALAVLVLVVNEISYRSLEVLNAQNAIILKARSLSDQVRRAALMMESAKRGYIMTERDAYLQPYTEVNRQLDPLLAEVRVFARSYPQGRQKLEAVVDAAQRKQAEMDEVLKRFRSGNRAGAMDLTLTEIGRETMVRINEIADQIQREQSMAYDRVTELRARVRAWSRFGIAFLVLVCVAAVFAALRLVRERENERARFLAQLSDERDKLGAQVDSRTQELTELARHLQRVREEERSHLARELHDELGGLLTTAKLDVARLKMRVDGTGPEAAERILHLSQTLDAGVALKRRIIEDLRPSSLDHLGLQRALEIQCSEFALRSEIRVQAEIDDLKLDPERALMIYRVVQEALTNVAKYGQASEVHVLLQRSGERLRLRVEDNGRGFDPSHIRQGSQGLVGMRFRVRSCGGDLILRSAPGQGTLIEVTLPL